MYKSRSSSYNIIIISLQVLATFHFHGLLLFINAGASSNSKNLVNLYTPNDSLNTTSPNQFQNEYQYRQGSSKPTTTDRNKPTPSSPGGDFLTDSLLNDPGNPSTLDYSFQDNRAMTNVPECEGRLKLNGSRGYITDGPKHYPVNLQCIWLIDSGRKNAIIRIQFHQFNTECNFDFLYIFDGDSIYSPLIAALSGDMKDFNNAFTEANVQDMISSNNNSPNLLTNSSNLSKPRQSKFVGYPQSRSFELKTNSGKAFIYFHSDTAQSMPGFYMTYSIDSCPLDCSNRGECDYQTLLCRCNPGYFGDGCQFTLCPNNCTSPLHGTCDKNKSCVCQDGFSGPDCSKVNDQQSWIQHLDTGAEIPPRAFHKACIVDDEMWILGGRSRVLSNTNNGTPAKKTPMIFSFDLAKRKWTDKVIEGIVGMDYLAELSSHSIATHGSKIFIYGGMAMNSTVLNLLNVFDTKSLTLNDIPSGKTSKAQDEEFVAPLAVVGHSANIINGHMYVFLGYNPIYGYLNFAQKFNLASNSWSIIERHGSSISGCIGHTSTVDPISRLVYIYGGHNALRSSKLYSFDPTTEVWTYLQAAPLHRYFHSSVVINNQLVVLGGNSYSTLHQSDQCFEQTYLTYDLTCSGRSTNSIPNERTTSPSNSTCIKKCWRSIDEIEPGVLKRHGHSVVVHDNKELILFGGFNGVLMNDIRFMSIPNCSGYTNEVDCTKPKVALTCYWDNFNSTCNSLNRDTSAESQSRECSAEDIQSLRSACAARDSCTDCLSTSFGCVWCGLISRCQHEECRPSFRKPIMDSNLCYKDEPVVDPLLSKNISESSFHSQEQEYELDCKLENCFMCQSKPHCSWQNEQCTYTPNIIPPLPTPMSIQEDSITNPVVPKHSALTNNTKGYFPKPDPFNKAFMDLLTTSLLNSSPYTSCDVPCFMRRSCGDCTTTKCIWCSTTEQCVDSSAYFAYHSMGQCMHYVAHQQKCPEASCADIETCKSCLTNPKCGWLNDISNTGKGRCIEGDSSGPLLNNQNLALNETVGVNLTHITGSSEGTTLANWHYTDCPACQCNGHSQCKLNSTSCMQPCQDHAVGPNCEKCLPGYFGNPKNGGVCKPCRCNGHAHTCKGETGKCSCSVKGIIGHHCNKCDDKNYYIGDPTTPNGTCFYNLTTDYQYTFNMSKPDDFHYSEINFINIPLRKESDADFSIACSRLALVNITSGTSYKSRRPIHTGLECGSFRLRFPHDRLNFSDANYSLFVHVYKFQTPFILQIAFSQQRTLLLPQFFFTCLSFFLFFFALFGLAWKLKHEYDQYVRRQRQFIEMEQMASRPFSTILLDVSADQKQFKAINTDKRPTEPTPISFEPCFGSNVGVLSVFVQLPGRPNLAIGSALVSLNDDTAIACDENEGNGKRQSSKQEHTSSKNH